MQGYISYDKSITVNETQTLVDYTNITLNGKSGRSIITFISHLHHQNVSDETSSLEAD